MTRRGVVIGIIVVLAIGAAILFLPRTTSTIQNYPSSGTTIIAFGDSLIAGTGADTEGGFVTMLSEDLDTPIINLGAWGNTTAEGLERIDAVLRLNPKVVMVLLGGNDALRHISREKTDSNLRTIVGRIEDTGAVVLLLGVRGGLFSDDYKDMFSAIAKDYKTAYVPDVLDGLFGNPEYMSDPIHPNEAGYRKIADRVRPVLGTLIN